MEGGVVRDAHHAHHQHLRKFSRKSARDDDRTKSLRDQNRAYHEFKIESLLRFSLEASFPRSSWRRKPAVRRHGDNILHQLPKYKHAASD